jgi:hypothetical protein
MRTAVLAAGELADAHVGTQRKQHQQQPALQHRGRDRLPVATEANSPVSPHRKSASLRMSSRSTTPQRRATSSFKAARVDGSGCGASFGTVIHGWPARLVIRTPPADPAASASSSWPSARRIRSCRAAMKAEGSRGWRSAA